MIEAKFDALAIDLKTNDYVILIKCSNDYSVVPIWIGNAEAFSIAIALEGIKPPRPLTHDLTKDIITAMGGKLTRVVITGIRENTYYALLHIQRGEIEEYVIDSRPSDAIALALRTECQIFISGEIASYDLDNPTDDVSIRLSDRIRKIEPEEMLGFLE